MLHCYHELIIGPIGPMNIGPMNIAPMNIGTMNMRIASSTEPMPRLAPAACDSAAVVIAEINQQRPHAQGSASALDRMEQ